jgi:hypothetical protein
MEKSIEEKLMCPGKCGTDLGGMKYFGLTMKKHLKVCAIGERKYERGSEGTRSERHVFVLKLAKVIK